MSSQEWYIGCEDVVDDSNACQDLLVGLSDNRTGDGDKNVPIDDIRTSVETTSNFSYRMSGTTKEPVPTLNSATVLKVVVFPMEAISKNG